MSNHNPHFDHLQQYKWRQGQSGNPAGRPKGSKNLRTWIHELINDDSLVIDGIRSGEIPVKAIIVSLISLAAQGNLKAFDILAKYGYGISPNNPMEDNESIHPVNLVIVKDKEDVSSDKVNDKAY